MNTNTSHPLLAIACLSTIISCSPGTTPPTSADPAAAQHAPQPAPSPDSTPTTTLRIEIEPLAEVPNSGLQLPRVSPDGKRVAYLRLPQGTPVPLDAALTGEGIGPVSLHIAETAADGDPREIAPEGACWPVWSPDGSRLACVAYDRAGRCQLVIRDIQRRRTRTLNLGFDHMITPAFSPSGRYVAVAVHQGDPAQSRIHLIDLDTAAVRPGPPPEPDAFQMTPIWLSENQLLYIAGRGRRIELRRWRLDTAASSPVQSLHISPASPAGVTHAFAGIAQPLSPDSRRLAYYDASKNRVTLTNLDTGQEHPLDEGTHAGCWLDPTHFAVAGDRALSLASTSGRPSRTLLEGPSLPRWTTQNPNQLILCAPASNRWNFQLLNLRW